MSRKNKDSSFSSLPIEELSEERGINIQPSEMCVYIYQIQIMHAYAVHSSVPHRRSGVGYFMQMEWFLYGYIKRDIYNQENGPKRQPKELRKE